jgi:hypothetical protein
VTAAASPIAVLTRDRRTFYKVGLITWAMTGIVTKFMTGFTPGMARGNTIWIVSVGVGLGIALLAASIQAAWATFTIIRCWLAFRRVIPWRLMSFLTDAHERGVLRQVGACYRFRHIELQHHLATAPCRRP